MTLPQVKQHWRSLLAFIGLIVLIQVLGNLATFSSVTTWYADLNRPSWSPPNWLFGPVWTLLYLMIAISGWLLWTKSPEPKFRHKPLVYYFVQLFFNALWSPIFFGLRMPVPALACLLLLLVFAVLTLISSYRQNHKTVACLFIPYCLWLSYAASLNAAIVYLN